MRETLNVTSSLLIESSWNALIFISEFILITFLNVFTKNTTTTKTKTKTKQKNIHFKFQKQGKPKQSFLYCWVIVRK